MKTKLTWRVGVAAVLAALGLAGLAGRSLGAEAAACRYKVDWLRWANVRASPYFEIGEPAAQTSPALDIG